MTTNSFIKRAIGVLAGASALLWLGVLPASAASTSFAVTNVVTAVNPGTCPANFFGSLTVGQSSSGTSTLDITGSTATQTLSTGLVLTGPVTGNVVSVAVERPVSAGGTTFTERRESTFTINGTAATGTSKLTATFSNGGTCSADFSLTGTLGAPLITAQPTTTTAAPATTTAATTTAAPATTAPPATTAAPTTAAPTTTASGALPQTGNDSTVVLAAGLSAVAAGLVALRLGRGRRGRRGRRERTA